MFFLLNLLIGFGVFMLLMGLSMFVKSSAISTFISNTFDNKNFYIVSLPLGALYSVFAVFILLYNGAWNSFTHFTLVLSIIAWLILIKGFVYLFLPENKIRALVSGMNLNSNKIKLFGIFYCLIGIYFLHSSISVITYIAQLTQL